MHIALGIIRKKSKPKICPVWQFAMSLVTTFYLSKSINAAQTLHMKTDKEDNI